MTSTRDATPVPRPVPRPSHYRAGVPVERAVGGQVAGPGDRPDDGVAYGTVEGNSGPDLLRLSVPVAAVGVVVYAAIADPAHPAQIALLAGAAGLFAAWALRPDRIPTLALTAGVLPAVVLAKGSGNLDVGLFLVSLLAIVVAGWEQSRTRLTIAAAAALATPVAVNLLRPGDVDVGIWLFGVALPGLMSWFFRRQEDLRSQLEESRRQLAAQRSADERRRIARDVHDLVGHGLAAVLLHVAGARHVLRHDPDEADAALAAAEDTGRRSLGELRATVALLRADGEDAVSAVPGVADIARLVTEARASGLDLDHAATGALDLVDPLVGLTLYRIAQEALLNAARHAPAARTRVTVAVTDAHVELRVDSRPTTTPPTGRRPGYGLVGMRERAAAVDGTVHAGPDGDGWSVRCTVPIAEATRP